MIAKGEVGVGNRPSSRVGTYIIARRYSLTGLILYACTCMRSRNMPGDGPAITGIAGEPAVVEMHARSSAGMGQRDRLERSVVADQRSEPEQAPGIQLLRRFRKLRRHAAGS